MLKYVYPARMEILKTTILAAKKKIESMLKIFSFCISRLLCVFQSSRIFRIERFYFIQLRCKPNVNAARVLSTMPDFLSMQTCLRALILFSTNRISRSFSIRLLGFYRSIRSFVLFFSRPHTARTHTRIRLVSIATKRDRMALADWSAMGEGLFVAGAR